jgi:hypothetical protein
VGEAYRSGGAGGSNRPNSLREPYAQGRGARDHRTDCRTHQRAAIEHAASERRAGAEYRAGVGRGHSGAIGAHPTAGQVRQWNGGWVQPHWRGNGHPFGWVHRAGRVSRRTGSGVPAVAPSITPSRTGEARLGGGAIRSRSQPGPACVRPVPLRCLGGLSCQSLALSNQLPEILFQSRRGSFPV